MSAQDWRQVLRDGTDAGLRAAMAAHGVLGGLVPGLAALDGCSHGTKMHFEGDVGAHTRLVVRNMRAAKELCRRLYPMLDIELGTLPPPDDLDLMAALLHDIMKPQTAVDLADGGRTFPGHEHAAAAMLRSLPLPFADIELLELHFVIYHHGEAHCFSELPSVTQRALMSHRAWWRLLYLQVADAQSAYLDPEGTKRLRTFVPEMLAAHLS